MAKQNKQPSRRQKGRMQGKGVTNHTVEKETELLPFLLETMSSRSRNSVKSILTRRQVAVDGEIITQHNHPLQPGQIISILNNKESLRRSELIGVTILHEDEDILVVNKAAGMLSVAGKDRSELDVYSQLSDFVKKEHPRNKIFVVHRLDRDTSGVLVYAKSEEMKNILQNEWHKRAKQRKYVAVVEGVVSKEKGTLSSWLTESETLKVFSSPVDNGGKHAVTHYRKLDGNRHYTLLEVELETGRKHQIRVHLSDIGHPVVGDKRYGAKTNALKRLGLHAWTLSIVHPRTNELVHFTSGVPGSFRRLVD